MPEGYEEFEVKFVSELVIGDCFEIGGCVYMIVGIAASADDDWIGFMLSLMSWQKMTYAEKPDDGATLTIPKTVKITTLK